MVSCTEFIPLYSELFKFIEDKKDHDAVVRYWEYVDDNYVSRLLEPLVMEKGMAGAWEYWTRALSEEAADIYYEYDDEKQEIFSHMRYCPSKGLLLSLKHMEPYYDYCGHCNVLYTRILRKYGIIAVNDNSGVDHAECKGLKYLAENEK